MIYITLFVFLTWTLYRFIYPENIMLDEVLIKPLLWLSPIFFVVRLKSLGLTKRNFVKPLLLGIFFGFLTSFERLTFNHNLVYQFSFLYIVTSLFTAITEEVFFRGYLLNRWLKSRLPIPLILFANGLLFTLFHVPFAIFKLHYWGFDLFTYLGSNFIFGFVDVILFYYTGSLYSSIANHFIWNIFSSIYR